MAQWLIGIEMELSNDFDDSQIIQDVITLLETTLPYMMDNVAVQSKRREDAETDNDGTPVLYFN